MVDKKIVEYVASLARIDISEEEKKLLIGQLSAILEYIDTLKEVDVAGVGPTRGALCGENIFRSDEAEEKDFFSDILNNAPAQEEDHFKIPKVIE